LKAAKVLFFEEGLRQFGSVAKSFTVNILQVKTFSGFSFTLAPGCRVWIWVSVFAYRALSFFKGSFTFSTAPSGCIGFTFFCFVN
jgi:hypothetical protein